MPEMTDADLVLYLKAIPYIPEVFSNGVALGREVLTKERHDKFIAFYAYEKWVKIGERDVLLKVKAGELSNGELEVLPDLLGHTFHIVRKNSARNTPLSSTHEVRYAETDNSQRSVEYTRLKENKTSTAFSNNSAILDAVQVKFSALTILEVKEPDPKTAFDDWLGR